MSTDIKTVLIAGYGTMGRGIVKTFVAGGFDCRVKTRVPDTPGPYPEGVSYSHELPEEAPDLVIEAIYEEFGAKVALFREIEDRYGARPGTGPIVASNTSGLSLQAMADRLAAPDRFLGIHYFHPAEAFPMVEAIRVAQTDDAVFEAACRALVKSGKEPIRLNMPALGALINRLQHAILHEAYHLVETGVATAEDVDNVAKRLLGPRMCVTGLIEQKDLGGLAIHALAQRSIVPALHHTGEPVRLLQDLYEKGRVGASAGRGFYDWRGRDVDAVKAKAADKLKRILAIVEED